MRGMMMAAGAAVLMAAPAAAQLQVINFTGTALVGAGGLNDPVLNSLSFTAVSGFFLYDAAASTVNVLGPLGAPGNQQGNAISLFRGVQGQNIDFANGVIIRTATSSPGSLLIADNVASGNPAPEATVIRLDQAIYTSNAQVFAGSFFSPADVSGPLPPDLFVSQVRLGRSFSTNFPVLPDLVTDLSNRDFFSYLTSAGPTSPFLSVTFRQGNPLGTGGINALPSRTINVTNLQFTLGGDNNSVPEPASWAMLIAGFGLVGATLRRRRALAA
jgi:PEP-CTERM motif